jgi:hypothetical protein
MADVGNANRPSGLRPVGTMGSAGYTGRVQVFATSTSDTQAIGIGDPVVPTSTGDAAGIMVATRLTQAGTTAILGAVVGIVPNPSDLTVGYRAASTNTKILVDTDSNTIYEVSDSDTVANTTCIAITDIGQNATLQLGTVDTNTGNGKTVLSTSIGTTTTLDVKILGLSPKVGNLVGDYAKYLVKINRHAYANSVIGT